MDTEKKFQFWMTVIDSDLIEAVGVGVDDLPDFAYRDHFDAGFTPTMTALIIRSENGA
jgi:hypothetical protein